MDLLMSHRNSEKFSPFNFVSFSPPPPHSPSSSFSSTSSLNPSSDSFLKSVFSQSPSKFFFRSRYFIQNRHFWMSRVSFLLGDSVFSMNFKNNPISDPQINLWHFLLKKLIIFSLFSSFLRISFHLRTPGVTSLGEGKKEEAFLWFSRALFICDSLEKGKFKKRIFYEKNFENL